VEYLSDLIAMGRKASDEASHGIFRLPILKFLGATRLTIQGGHIYADDLRTETGSENNASRRSSVQVSQGLKYG
jgi:hypothetical protein